MAWLIFALRRADLPPGSKRVVYHDELVALLPAAHPLAAKEKVTLADLASEPFAAAG